MKNGEEVVSVGGAVDPSLKNVGTSASNSVLLDLAKVMTILNIDTYIKIDNDFRETRFGFSYFEEVWWRPQTGRQDILLSPV